MDTDALCVVSERLKVADNKIKHLSAKMTSLEEVNASLSLATPSVAVDALCDVPNLLQTITNKCDNAENRMRRSNILFF